MLLVSGIDAIYVKRYESESYLNPCGGPSLGPYERQRLIAEMLGVPPDAISWNIYPTTTFPFYSDEQFGRELLQFVDQEEQKYRQTAIALVDRGLMTSAEVEQSAPNSRSTRMTCVERTRAQYRRLPPSQEKWSGSVSQHGNNVLAGLCG